MSNYRSDLIDIDVVLVHKTDKAWLIRDADGNDIWIAKSQAELDQSKPGKWVLTLPQWLAEQKELI